MTRYPIPGASAVFCCALLCLSCAPALAATLKVVVPPTDPTAKAHADFFPKLLDLALRRTVPAYGPFTITAYQWPVSTERSAEELRAGRAINVIWTATSPARERALLPVRISLLRELNNYRIFLIRKDDQSRFDQVRSADDLRKLHAGLGAHWADSAIMRSNGFAVTTALHYKALFPMLALGRFDYFPRGLYEVWDEEQSHRGEGFSIEKKLMLYYPAPFYFFVNKKEHALAERIETGLKMAQEDGSFERLLLSFPGFKRGLEEQRKHHRKLFVLNAEQTLPDARPAPGGGAGSAAGRAGDNRR